MSPPNVQMPDWIGIAAASIASVLLLLISVLVITRRRTLADTLLCSTALLLAAVEITDQVFLAYPPGYHSVKTLKLFLESLLPFFLLSFSLAYARRDPLRSLSRRWMFVAALSALFPASVIIFPSVSFFYAPDLPSEKMIFLDAVGYWFYLGIIGYCVLALMNMESVFSAAPVTVRQTVKTKLVGMVSILAVLIFYYSQGLLYRTINMQFIPVRSGIVAVAALLIGYSKLFREHDTRIVISRRIVYRSITLLSAGIYFVILGLVGEGMKYFGSSFGRILVFFIAFVSGIAALSVLSSRKIRRRAKVFIDKNFYAHKHDYRGEWLKLTGRLASCKTVEDVHHRILLTYSEAFGLKGISLYVPHPAGGAYYRAAHQEMDEEPQELRLSAGLAAYFVGRDRVLNPFDGEYPATPDELSFIRQTGAGLLVPLVANGNIEGIVVFGKQILTEEFIFEDYDLMKTLARQAAQAVVNFRLSEELAETREIAAVAKISSFVIHDLKNLAYSLSLLLENADEYIGEPEFQKDMVGTIRNTVAKMKNLIQKLKHVPEKGRLSKARADISLLAGETVDEIRKLKTGLAIDCRGEPAVSFIDAEEIRKVILNLLLNASDAMGRKGAVTVETGVRDGYCFVSVGDEGCGMSEDFIKNHLFRPFRTTKEKGLGIGLYQCRQIVDAHDGRIEVRSSSGKGTVFTVFLPLAENSAYAAQ